MAGQLSAPVSRLPPDPSSSSTRSHRSSPRPGTANPAWGLTTSAGGEDGRLAADGTHAELFETSPMYREIVEKGMPDQVFLTREGTEQEVAGL